MAEQVLTYSQINTGAVFGSWADMGTSDTGAPMYIPPGSRAITIQAYSASWAGTLSMQASLDGVTWGPLVDKAGTAITFTGDGVKFSDVCPLWIRPSMSANAITLKMRAYVTK